MSENADARVEMAVNKALTEYMEKLQSGALRIESEASFQHHLALLIINYLSNDIYLEKKYKLNKHNNYVDIVIEYKKREYLIELKLKKARQKAEPQNVIECFKDIYNLEQLANRKFEGKEIKFCYFIFLTDHKLYTEKPSNEKDIRNSFPMWDKETETIKANQLYNDSRETAKKSLKKYPRSFKFKHSYDINYYKITTHKNKNLWFFKLKIPPK